MEIQAVSAFYASVVKLFSILHTMEMGFHTAIAYELIHKTPFIPLNANTNKFDKITVV
jgi:hypothetical protein